MLVGYLRALPDLAVAPQRTALHRAACQKLYEEPALAPRQFGERDRMLDHLWDGDIVVVARLECLADTLADLILVGQRLHDREAGLLSRTETWADTTTAPGASVLAVLNGLALLMPHLESAAAPVAAVMRQAPPPYAKMGRPSKITPQQWETYGARILSGELSVPAAAKLMGCGRATLYRHLADTRPDPLDPSKRRQPGQA
jgi:DNA invertase Pin-like site-specific DNA recombinase